MWESKCLSAACIVTVGLLTIAYTFPALRGVSIGGIDSSRSLNVTPEKELIWCRRHWKAGGDTTSEEQP